MKDLYYFIGFLSITFYIYNILYYDYLKDYDNKFLSFNKQRMMEYDSMIFFFGFIVHRFVPMVVANFWLLVGVFSSNGFIILVFLLSSGFYDFIFDIRKFDETNNKIKKRNKKEVTYFSLITIFLILFCIYNTYYLKLDLMDYCLSLF